MRVLALAGVHLVVWAGGPAPMHSAAGLELTPAGQVRTISADKTHTLSLSRDALARLRRAVVGFLDKRPRSVNTPDVDGGYVAAFAQDGARAGGAVDNGTTSPAVAQLLDALPRTTAVRAQAPQPERPVPATQPCDFGKSPTEVVQDVPLSLAKDRGLIKLTAKGPISGDSVAVDGQWARFPELPVHVTVHLEIVHQPGDTTPYAENVKAALDSGYAGVTTDDGQRLDFTFDVVERAWSAAPRKCFHEVIMHPKADIRGEMSDLGPKQLTGDWEALEEWSWKHEMGHILGIDDHYKTFFVFHKGKHPDIELPNNKPTPAEVREAIGPRFSMRDGQLQAKSFATTRDDFMGATRGGHLRKVDARRIAMRAELVVHAVPGEILLNEDASAQNLVIGAPFDLPIPTNGFAHVNGMVAYCIDFHRRPPYDNPVAMDLLGRAGDLGNPAMSALQRVVDVIAAREPGPLQDTPGANDAIWRVTDDEPVPDEDPAAQAILDAAGIPADATFNAPHFTDPAAVAVTIGGPGGIYAVPTAGGALRHVPGTTNADPASSLSHRTRASIHGDTVRVGTHTVWTGDGEWSPEQALAGAGGRVAIVARRDGSGNGAWELLLGRPLHRALYLGLGDTHAGEIDLDGVDRSGRHVRVTRVLDHHFSHLTFSL